MNNGWTRRDFLRATGAAAVTLGLSKLEIARAAEPPAATAGTGAPSLPSIPAYRTWEDVYRQRWTWDRVVRGTHTMTNCVSGCAWDLYVKDNMVWREEQKSPYTASNPQLPDFNPRGCQKGACGSVLMYSPSRIRYPMKRAGERGEGRWQRISWEEALGTVAGAMVDAIEKEGPAAVLCSMGPNIGAGANSAAPMRFFRSLGSPTIDSMAQVGDLPLGAVITLGNGHPCGSSDDWWRSSYIVMWSFNPSATRIPDAHFLWEARYRGAQVVAVCPDMNNSSMHTDLWLNPKPGTDAALALGAVQVIIEENLHNAAFIAEQTDLPLLLRTDTRRFLRRSDLEKGGSEEAFYVWDAAAKAPVPAPGSGESKQLDSSGLNIDINFTGSVTINGKPVKVRTVFSQLREQLDGAYRPEKVAEITGVAANTIRLFARGFAKAKAALILSSWGQCKFLHADLMQRAQILLASITGNFGRPGGGWRSGGFFAPEGFALLGIQERLGLIDLAGFAAKNYFDPEETERFFSSYFVPGNIWHQVHGDLTGVSGDPKHGDQSTPRPAADYLREALEKKWFPMFPQKGRAPQVILSIFGNVLRHARNNIRLRENLWPKVKLAVDVNFRMNETGRWADIILPAAFWYEKADLKYLVSFIPYVHLGDRAVDPLDEAKPEWEIFSLLAEAVAAEARKRAMQPYKDIAGAERDARRLDEAFSDRGRFGAKDEDKALEFVFSYSSITSKLTLDDFRREGAIRFKSSGAPGGAAGYFSDYSETEPMVPHQWFVGKKQRWPTLTGRQQFYIDHPWFLECGEALPVHKAPPQAGGNYPLVLSGGHTRWSIHSTWRDQRPMLRLQRGEPVVYISSRDAEERGIQDHDLVRVRNDLGSFVLRAKLARYVPPGMVLVYHAWEPYMFREGNSDHGITPSPFKPTNLVGGYGHLHWAYSHWEPNQVDRDTRVEIERI
ncbi:MAG: molybdopterin-dependent oxidoreductase [Deltaproteobacteria bacterium]|nr:molybdopterin-dependent oxidoreductase [Deltaproteobacteria bacterium]